MDTVPGAAIIAAAGAAGLFFFGRPIGSAWRARRWPHAQGTVTRSWTETVSRQIDPTDSISPTTSRINVRVSYRFVVAGTVHTSDRVTFFPATMSHGFPQLAREHCDRYAAGTAVDVRYDPRSPSEAVIETHIPRASSLAAGVAALVLAAGLVGLIRLLVS
jgi:uncharacterized protein DUF3592